MSEENNNEELRPSKMRGVAFPKAKYGVILAVIVIIVVNLIYSVSYTHLTLPTILRV